MTLQPATAGDTNTLHETLTQCGEHIREVAVDIDNKDGRMNSEGPAELVLDKGYHSNDVLVILKEVEVRSYCYEPDRGRRTGRVSRKRKRRFIRTVGGYGGAWKAAVATARRTRRTELRSYVRNRRHAKNAPAASRQHHQAVAHSCRCVQPGPGDEKNIGKRNPERVAGKTECAFVRRSTAMESPTSCRNPPVASIKPPSVTSHQGATPYRIPLLCLNSRAPFFKISSATGC